MPENIPYLVEQGIWLTAFEIARVSEFKVAQYGQFGEKSRYISLFAGNL